MGWCSFWHRATAGWEENLGGGLSWRGGGPVTNSPRRTRRNKKNISTVEKDTNDDD